MRSCLYFSVHLLGGALHADLERDRGVLDRLTVGPRDRLHAGDARHPEDGLGDLVDDQEVGRVAQVVVALDQQQFGVHPGLREMPIGGRVSLVGRQVGGQVIAVVVVGLVAGQGQQADQRQGDRADQDGPGPPDDRGADLAPSAHPHLSLGFEHLAETAGHGDDARGSA